MNLPLCILTCAGFLVAAEVAQSREILELTARSIEPGPALEIRIKGSVSDSEPFRLERRIAGTFEDDITYNTVETWVEIAPTISSTGTTGFFIDTNIVVGQAYEYHAEKINNTSSEGFGVGGIRVPAPEHRGTVLLVIEQSLTNTLTDEIEQLAIDLAGDGWTVASTAAPRHIDNPVDGAARLAQIQPIQAAISNLYFADTNELKAVFLIGRVPIPYTLAVQDPSWAANYPPYPPDGHAEHAGCWPTDLYYADFFQDFTNFNYRWQDDVRAWTNSGIPRCSTVPGDGKFDNYRTPTRMDVQIGRIDFSSLPASPLSETELVRQYLNKDHRYRKAGLSFRRTAAVTDDKASIRRTFPSWFGTNAYTITAMSTALTDTNGYYGIFANGAGSFYSVGTHYTSWDLIATDPCFFIHIADGSYFGDWDSENNLLRAALAGKNGGLASLAALDFDPLTPHVNIDWSLNHMALGETIGYGVRHTINRAFESTWRYSARPSASYNLLGDPTLRLFPVAPPVEALAFSDDNDVRINWAPSPNTDVVGYHVYASTNGIAGPFARINPDLIITTSCVHSAGLSTNVVTYQVRAVRIEETGAGTYENTSIGTFTAASAGPIPLVMIQTVDASASEAGADTAAVRFTRTGETTSDLIVFFSIEGTASADDYTLSATNTITIPAGQPQTLLQITPTGDDLLEGEETVIVRLTTDPSCEAWIYRHATLQLSDEDTLPGTPSGLSVVEVPEGAMLQWTDNATNETRYLIERRITSGGASFVIDNEDTTGVTFFPDAIWELRAFENAYDGTCRGVKKIGGTYYVDYALGSVFTGAVDVAWWHPSGSQDGALTDSQLIYMHHANGVTTNVVNMQIDGGTWKDLGAFNLNTGSFIRVEGVTTGYRWTVADAVRIEKRFEVVVELGSDATGWTDTNVSAGLAYEYRVRSGLENTTSAASVSAQLGMTGGGTNQAPEVDAGIGGTITADQTFQLNGTASDPDSGPLALQTMWLKVSGPGSVVFGNLHDPETTAGFSTNGTYELGLTASDGLATVTDLVAVVVQPARRPGAGASNGVPFVVDEDTIALWHFDADGTDSGTNGLHLILSGASIVTGGTATAWMATPSGAALRVDNFPQTATGTVPDSLVFNAANPTPLTLEVRFYMESWGSNTASYTMIGLEQNYDTHMNLEQGSGGPEAGFLSGCRDSVIASPQQLEPYWSTGVWHHLMFIFDGTNQTAAFLDGVRVGQTVVEVPNWGRVNNAWLTFGNLVGYIDEARLSRTLREAPVPVVILNEPVIADIHAHPTDHGLQLGIGTVTGQQYILDGSARLINSEWLEITNMSGDGETIWIDLGTATSAFYRIRTLATP